jgi:hypothetical protein
MCPSEASITLSGPGGRKPNRHRRPPDTIYLHAAAKLVHQRSYDPHAKRVRPGKVSARSYANAGILNHQELAILTFGMPDNRHVTLLTPWKGMLQHVSEQLGENQGARQGSIQRDGEIFNV